jgi:hypothetical protein
MWDEYEVGFPCAQQKNKVHSLLYGILQLAFLSNPWGSQWYGVHSKAARGQFFSSTWG